MEGEFRDGENIVLYCSEEELLEKTAFYLEHDGERARIAANGREYVRSRHALSRHLFEMLGMACGSDALLCSSGPDCDYIRRSFPQLDDVRLIPNPAENPETLFSELFSLAERYPA